MKIVNVAARKEKRKLKGESHRVTGREWVESLTEDLFKVRKLSPKKAHGDANAVPVDPAAEFPSVKTVEKVARCVHQVLIHHPARNAQYELPQNKRSSLTLHLSQEPRKGVQLSLADKIRLMILKRRIVAIRKNSSVAEIRHNPYGIPDFEELYHATDQHVAFQRRKLFDPLLDPAKRRYAFDSILNDYDILCPIKPSPHLKQMSRQRDRYRLCLIGRSARGCPFEASDFMARWVYRRSLQSMELNGMQLTMIKEDGVDCDPLDLSRAGSYQYGKCLASKLVAARKSARHTLRESNSEPPGENMPDIKAVDSDLHSFLSGMSHLKSFDTSSNLTFPTCDRSESAEIV
ncbi:uncharacterized protein LOC129586784 [Paramacrobiotus metropolitanus]|uniref:uncharacterized protein LOC129586784 n=1 Tax=Paramacrobiotus metropolitanus TaxID=2943436 RepID=UPI002446361E|nr:uncharacterized protein LOC129586784 [Paramacrobiotus metropolitanus]